MSDFEGQGALSGKAIFPVSLHNGPKDRVFSRSLPPEIGIFFDVFQIFPQTSGLFQFLYITRKSLTGESVLLWVSNVWHGVING